MPKLENTEYLQKVSCVPIRSPACVVDANEFASFFSISSSNLLTTTDDDKNIIQSISIFSLEELERALKGMSNLRSADEDGIVVAMIKYANIKFK